MYNISNMPLDIEKIFEEGFFCGEYHVFFEDYFLRNNTIRVTITWGFGEQYELLAFASDIPHRDIVLKTLAWIEQRFQKDLQQIQEWMQQYIKQE